MPTLRTTQVVQPAEVSSVGPFPLIVGSGRSGTTVFGRILDSHPSLAVAHEAHFVAGIATRHPDLLRNFDSNLFLKALEANPNFRRLGIPAADVRAKFDSLSPRSYDSAVRTVFEVFAHREGKPYFGDKTPGYVSHLGWLGKTFPDAKFLHVIRDGRDVALAYLDRPEWGPRTIAEAASYWKGRVTRGREAGLELGPSRYLEVRYEELVDQPDRVVADACRFLGLEFRPEMLRYHERELGFVAKTKDPSAFETSAAPLQRGLRDWRNQMPKSDIVLFEAIAGDALEAFSYPRSGLPRTPATLLRVPLGRVGWQLRRVASRLARRKRA